MVTMARRKKSSDRAALRAGITFASFLTQLALLADDKATHQNLKDANRVMKALRLLELLGDK